MLAYVPAHICRISTGKRANTTFYVLAVMNMDNSILHDHLL